MLLGKFDNISLLSILIVTMYGINQIDAKEFINDELNIKFEYPDEWKSTPLSRQAATFGIEYDQVPIVSLDVDPKPPIFNFLNVNSIY